MSAANGDTETELVMSNHLSVSFPPPPPYTCAILFCYRLTERRGSLHSYRKSDTVHVYYTVLLSH